MNLKPGAHVHFIGVCGTAMASLAGLFKSMGYRVTGSDQNVYPPMSTQLQELGISIQNGYRKENLKPRPDLVIVGNVISKSNEEATALLESDIPYTSLPKAMGEFAIGDRNSIIVAGTHGKTTTTAMMIRVLDEAKKGAGYMVGGIPMETGRSFRLAEGNYFIIEGDEYDTAFFDKVPKFIYYRPKYVILTSVEFDHADIYKDLDDVKRAFRMLVDLIPADGVLVAYRDHENVMDVIRGAKCRVITYGSVPENHADYMLVDREMLSGRNHFVVQAGGQRVADVALKSPGEHNALNALAVFALTQEIGGIALNQVLQGLAQFQGVKRRQEVIASNQGITVIEDFAHHPTAVKVTTEAIRERFVQSGGRLFCLFEPRSATSRRKIFQKEYVKAFRAGDEILIAKAYDQSKILETDRFSTAELVADLKNAGQEAKEFSGVDEIVQYVKSHAKKNDVVLIMSNGGFDGIYQKLKTVL